MGSAEEARDGVPSHDMIWATRFAAKGAILAVSKDRLAGMCVDGSGPDAAKDEKLRVVMIALMTGCGQGRVSSAPRAGQAGTYSCRALRRRRFSGPGGSTLAYGRRSLLSN